MVGALLVWDSPEKAFLEVIYPRTAMRASRRLFCRKPLSLLAVHFSSEVFCTTSRKQLSLNSYSITRNNSEGPSQKPRQLSANLQTVGNPLAKEAAAQPMISTDPDSRITQERKFLENMRAQIDERLLELDQLQTSSKIAIGQVERPRTYAVRNFAKPCYSKTSLIKTLQQTQSNIQNRGYRTAPIDLQHQISSRSNAQSSSQNAKKKRLSPKKGRPRGETCIRCKLQKLKVYIYFNIVNLRLTNAI